MFDPTFALIEVFAPFMFIGKVFLTPSNKLSILSITCRSPIDQAENESENNMYHYWGFYKVDLDSKPSLQGQIHRNGYKIPDKKIKKTKCPDIKNYIHKSKIPDMSQYIRKDSIPCWACKL